MMRDDYEPDEAESAYLSSVTPFYCNKCGVKFDKFWNLHEHIFNSDDHHFNCPKCCYSVGYTIAEVINHVKNVCGWAAFYLVEAQLKTSTFRYYCDRCGKGFDTFSAFKLHYIGHPAELINCICCNFKPRSLQSLLIHLKHHFVAGNIELVCQVCSLQFHALYSYQQHYFIVHSQLANIPFKCCICSEVIFDDEDKFTWHLQQHSDIIRKRKELAINDELNKTTCEICSKIFPTVEACEKHRAKMHLLQSNPNLKKLCPFCMVLITVKEISNHLRCHYKEANKDFKLLSVYNALEKKQLVSKLREEELKTIPKDPDDQRKICTILNREIIFRNPVSYPLTSTNIDVPLKPLAEKPVSRKNEKEKEVANTKILTQAVTLAKEQTVTNTKDTRFESGNTQSDVGIIIQKQIILHPPVVQPSGNPLISTNIKVPQTSITEKEKGEAKTLIKLQLLKKRTPVSKEQTKERPEKKEMESTHEVAAKPKPVQQTNIKKDITLPSSDLPLLPSTNLKIPSKSITEELLMIHESKKQNKNIKLKDIPPDKPVNKPKPETSSPKSITEKLLLIHQKASKSISDQSSSQKPKETSLNLSAQLQTFLESSATKENISKTPTPTLHKKHPAPKPKPWLSVVAKPPTIRAKVKSELYGDSPERNVCEPWGNIISESLENDKIPKDSHLERIDSPELEDSYLNDVPPTSGSLRFPVADRSPPAPPIIFPPSPPPPPTFVDTRSSSESDDNNYLDAVFSNLKHKSSSHEMFASESEESYINAKKSKTWRKTTIQTQPVGSSTRTPAILIIDSDDDASYPTAPCTDEPFFDFEKDLITVNDQFRNPDDNREVTASKFRCPSPVIDRNPPQELPLASSGWSSPSSEEGQRSRSPSPFDRVLICNPVPANDKIIRNQSPPIPIIAESIPLINPASATDKIIRNQSPPIPVIAKSIPLINPAKQKHQSVSEAKEMLLKISKENEKISLDSELLVVLSKKDKAHRLQRLTSFSSSSSSDLEESSSSENLKTQTHRPLSFPSKVISRREEGESPKIHLPKVRSKSPLPSLEWRKNIRLNLLSRMTPNVSTVLSPFPSISSNEQKPEEYNPESPVSSSSSQSIVKEDKSDTSLGIVTKVRETCGFKERESKFLEGFPSLSESRKQQQDAENMARQSKKLKKGSSVASSSCGSQEFISYNKSKRRSTSSSSRSDIAKEQCDSQKAFKRHAKFIVRSPSSSELDILLEHKKERVPRTDSKAQKGPAYKHLTAQSISKPSSERPNSPNPQLKFSQFLSESASDASTKHKLNSPPTKIRFQSPKHFDLNESDGSSSKSEKRSNKNRKHLKKVHKSTNVSGGSAKDHSKSPPPDEFDIFPL